MPVDEVRHEDSVEGSKANESESPTGFSRAVLGPRLEESELI